ncbi:T9SS type A sorting domain-containing protein [bacterium]|nr:T9SS type A sorting domain-containing protein [bacterium]
MLKCKVFTVCVLSLALLLTVAFPTNAKIMPDPITGELSLKVLPSHRAYTPQRDDEDAFWTYRFMHTADGGANWGDITGIGDLGMWEIDGEDTLSVYASAFEAFGTVVCANNILHIIAVNNGFGEFNPMEKLNGLYHYGVTADGQVACDLIAAQAEGQDFLWSDAGIDADGNLYAIWWNPVVPDEGDSYGELFASKSTDGGANWSDAFLVSEELDVEYAFPHMTSMVGEYFYVIHQMPNAETENYDQYVIKVPAALAGEIVNMDPGVASGTEVSYYTAAVDPIAQDVTTGYVFFCVRNADLSAVSVTATSDGGANWTTVDVGGAQRYPSLVFDTAEGIPWVFSNVGVPVDRPDTLDYHTCWYAFDENGYGGNLWTDATNYMQVDYPGEMLYTAGGAFTTGGTLIAGCNIWAYPDPYITPIGYAVVTTDDYGENWSEMMRLWDIWDTGLEGGPLSHCQLMAGPDNAAWLVFGGRYGYTDLVPPEIKVADISSVMLGEPKVVTVDVMDEVGIYDYDGEGPWDVWMDLYLVTEDTLWMGMSEITYDSVHIDNHGLGCYFYHLPDSLGYMVNDSTMEKRALSPGDAVEFYAYGWDEAGNLGMDDTRTWTVNQGWTEVKDNVSLPMDFEIGQNYPNPFNNSTVIPFTLNRPANVEISVFDLNGRLVSKVYNGKAAAGKNVVSWEGNGITTGVYIYTVEANGVRRVGKMTLLR